jgi:hypothetical protein
MSSDPRCGVVMHACHDEADFEALACTKRITLYSSHGEAVFDAVTGECLRDSLSCTDWPWEHHPKRLDLGEFRRLNPGVEPVGEFDILYFGYWMNNGRHEPAVLDGIEA